MKNGNRQRAPQFARAAGSAALLCGLLIAGSAQAQSITYGPDAAAIPTLGGTALILLAAGMLFAFWKMQRNGWQGGRFMALALAVGALASGTSGIKLVKDAIAVSNELVELTSPGGGTMPLRPGLNCVGNLTLVAQRILSIDTLSFIPASIDVVEPHNGGANEGGCPDTTQTNGGGPASACVAQSTVLQPTQVCSVFVDFQIGNNGGQASDARLKTDIERIGTADNGLPLYEYRYLGGSVRFRGVMAQDVLQHSPQAVVTTRNGFMAVRYDLLGLEMTRVE